MSSNSIPEERNGAVSPDKVVGPTERIQASKISGPQGGAPIPAGFKFGAKDEVPERDRKAKSGRWGFGFGKMGESDESFSLESTMRSSSSGEASKNFTDFLCSLLRYSDFFSQPGQLQRTLSLNPVPSLEFLSLSPSESPRSLNSPRWCIGASSTSRRSMRSWRRGSTGSVEARR